MHATEAIRLIRPAVGSKPGTTWADLGAGRGTFTEALAEVLGSGGRVLGLDIDSGAVRALRRLASRDTGERAVIEPVEGDVRRLGAVPEIVEVELDGVLLANVLHYVPDPTDVLAGVVERLRSGGRLVVIEYEGRSSSPWVPHPLPFDRFRSVAVRSGIPEPEVVSRRDSAYRGEMYCAVARHREGAGGPRGSDPNGSPRAPGSSG